MTDFNALFNRQRAYFRTDITKTYAWRMDQLTRMERLLSENEDAICEALRKDFKTPRLEQLFEVKGPLGVVAATKKDLQEWMEPAEAPLPEALAASGNKGYIYREPYGVTLIIGPFNAPVLLLLEPAIAALAAGNTAIIKPAESTPATCDIMSELVSKYFEPEALQVVTGSKDEVTALLKLPFDFIFFTGSQTVGKVVMRAAAENLTPVLLELGGMNPTIVDETADLEDAAEKIAWGANAIGGQWCVSPGYVYVHASVADRFVETIKAALHRMYGPDPLNGADMSRIISDRDMERLIGMLEPSRTVYGGRYDKAQRYMEPAVIYPATWQDKCMQGEIFGPILPILPYTDLESMLATVKDQPKPLAAYLFSNRKDTVDRVLGAISFGGGCVNQTNVHCWFEGMPFGGVGPSGLGAYHGRIGFDALTHPKSVLHSNAQSKTNVFYPPYDQDKIDKAMTFFA
jgi:aldehyde dehydrogenase (NAD+)